MPFISDVILMWISENSNCYYTVFAPKEEELKRQKREQRLEMIRNNVQLKYAMKRKVGGSCTKAAQKSTPRLQADPRNFSVCVSRAMKMMRLSSCSSSVKRNRQRCKEIKRTRSLLSPNMRVMRSQRRLRAGEGGHHLVSSHIIKCHITVRSCGEQTMTAACVLFSCSGFLLVRMIQMMNWSRSMSLRCASDTFHIAQECPTAV